VNHFHLRYSFDTFHFASIYIHTPQFLRELKIKQTKKEWEFTFMMK